MVVLRVPVDEKHNLLAALVSMVNFVSTVNKLSLILTKACWFGLSQIKVLKLCPIFEAVIGVTLFNPVMVQVEPFAQAIVGKVNVELGILCKYLPPLNTVITALLVVLSKVPPAYSKVPDTLKSLPLTLFRVKVPPVTIFKVPPELIVIWSPTSFESQVIICPVRITILLEAALGIKVAAVHAILFPELSQLVNSFHFPLPALL